MMGAWDLLSSRLTGREPAEGYELIAPAEGEVKGGGWKGGQLGGVLGIDIITGAPEDCFASGAGSDDSARCVAGIAIGADGEGVVTRGKNGRDGAEDIGLAGPTGETVGVVAFSGSGEFVTRIGGGWWGSGGFFGAALKDGKRIEGCVFFEGVQGGLEGPGAGFFVRRGSELAVDELGEREERPARSDLFDDFLGEAVERRSVEFAVSGEFSAAGESAG